MPEEIHHHHYHHRWGGGCLLDALIVFLVLAAIGGITSQSDGSGIQAALGVCLVGYVIYRIIATRGRDDSADPE